MTRRGILTGGTWCIDRNLLLDNWPAENGRADILRADMSGGGSGCNMAIDIRKLDPALPVATIALVGHDTEGRFLLALADAHGIDRTRMIVTTEAPTDYTFAFSSLPSGQRTHISYFGTSHLLTPDHFDFEGSEHRIFHLGLPGIHNIMDNRWNGDANGWVATLKKARAAGLQTNLELASIAPERLAALVRPCLPHLDLLVVNDHEIAGIAGFETVRDGRTDPAACVAAAKAVLAMGAMRMVAVHFPKGGIVALRDGTVVSRPSVQVPASEIAGANGAGDAFAAGFVYGFHEGWSTDDALTLAHAVAAASLREISTTASVEHWSSCLALAETWGWREALQ
jgi:sugar/nucleoside kinase (ribokinase family)